MSYRTGLFEKSSYTISHSNPEQSNVTTLYLYPGKVTDRCPEDYPFLGDGSFIVAQYGYNIENYTRNCIALAGLAIGWRLLAYLYLCYRFRPSNR